MKTEIGIGEIWKHNFLDNQYLVIGDHYLPNLNNARFVIVISDDEVDEYVLLEEYILQFYHKLKLAGEKTNENKPK